jgi:high-affinity iron transporter
MSSQGDVVAGTLTGLATACVLGVVLYRGSRHIHIRVFFDVTGALIILFAAGLVAKTVLFVQGAGDLGTLNNAVYDLTSVRWLTVETQAGRFLGGIFGWDPRPSLEQVVGYLLYLVPIAWLYFGHRGTPRLSPSRAPVVHEMSFVPGQPSLPDAP